MIYVTLRGPQDHHRGLGMPSWTAAHSMQMMSLPSSSVSTSPIPRPHRAQMAVLRSNRLFLRGVPPGALGAWDDPPAVLPAGVEGFTSSAFTVPTGYLAIVRTITAVLAGSVTSTTSPSTFCYIVPVGQGQHLTLWMPHGTFGSTVNTWRPTAEFHGMIVMFEGESMTFGHNHTTDVVVQGSGMMMKRVTQAGTSGTLDSW